MIEKDLDRRGKYVLWAKMVFETVCGWSPRK
jgi:hypothetical protein